MCAHCAGHLAHHLCVSVCVLSRTPPRHRNAGPRLPVMLPLVTLALPQSLMLQVCGSFQNAPCMSAHGSAALVHLGSMACDKIQPPPVALIRSLRPFPPPFLLAWPGPRSCSRHTHTCVPLSFFQTSCNSGCTGHSQRVLEERALEEVLLPLGMVVHSIPVCFLIPFRQLILIVCCMPQQADRRADEAMAAQCCAHLTCATTK